MRLFFAFIIMLMSVLAIGQQEATLLGNWQDSTITPTSWLDSRYNEVWGMSVNNTEIGIIGSTRGVHFIDVTSPENLYEIESAFVRGAATGTSLVHRDYHDYEGYLYAVADEGPSTLQIIDCSELPDTTYLVYDSDTLIRRAHNIFIDSASAILYACSGISATGFFNLLLLDISDPVNPVMIASYGNSINGQPLPSIHDLYVRNDTAYVNGSTSGLFVYDFSDLESPLLLGALTSYPDQGYNHSGWLDDSGDYYYMADETHGQDMKVVDVRNMDDMEVLLLFDANTPADSISIPHNLIAHCQYLYVAHYYDGLQVYNIQDPDNPRHFRKYDTFAGEDEAFFAGAWGVYPFLPSGNILLSDMQTGLYVFEAMPDACAGISTSVEAITLSTGIKMAPNPVQRGETLSIQIDPTFSAGQLRFMDSTGRLISSNEWRQTSSGIEIMTNGLDGGLYFAEIIADGQKYVAKIVVL